MEKEQTGYEEGPSLHCCRPKGIDCVFSKSTLLCSLTGLIIIALCFGLAVIRQSSYGPSIEAARTELNRQEKFPSPAEIQAEKMKQREQKMKLVSAISEEMKRARISSASDGPYSITKRVVVSEWNYNIASTFLDKDFPEIYDATPASSRDAFSKAFEERKLIAAINQQLETQTSNIVIEPIESGFPTIVPDEEERKLAKASDVPDGQKVNAPTELLSSVALTASDGKNQVGMKKPPIKKAVYRKFEGKKEVPKPSKVSTGGFDVATLSFVATVFASTLDDLPENIGRKLTTLAKSSFSDFPQIPKSNPVSTSKNEREEPPAQVSLAREVNPVSPPSNHFGGFARLRKKEAVKHVEKLMKLNNIEDPTKLPIGMTIQVPLDPTDEGSPTQGYKVLKRDCPYKIALKLWGDGNYSSPHKKAKSSKAKMAKAKMRGGDASSTP